MSQPFSGISTVVVSQEQVSADMNGEVMILGMRAARYYSLDPVGCRIWSLIQQPILITELCDRLLAEYEVAPEQCQSEVIQLLTELHREGLIEACVPVA